MNLAFKLLAMAAVGLGFYLGQSDAFGQPPRRDEGQRQDRQNEVRPNRDGPRDGAEQRKGDGDGQKMSQHHKHHKHHKHAMKQFAKHHRHHKHGAGQRGPDGNARGPQARGEQFRGDRGRGDRFRGEQDRGPGPQGENRRGPDFRGPNGQRPGPDGRGPRNRDRRDQMDGGHRHAPKPDMSAPEGPRDGN